MKKLIFLFAALYSAANAFDYEAFKNKYCYEDQKIRTTAYYFPYITYQAKTLPGIVCEMFSLKKDDLDYMAKNSFVFSNHSYIFLKNCEMEYLNEYFFSKFPKINGMYFENCKISLKNQEIKANVYVSTGFLNLGFHNCIINNNSESNALHSITRLQHLYISNSRLEYPIIDEQLIRRSSLFLLAIDKVNVKNFEKGLLAKRTHYFSGIVCNSCELDELDSLFYGFNQNIKNNFLFANNNITKFPTTFANFTIFYDLPEIDLSGNQISERILDRVFFKSLSNLKILDLSRNANLTEIDYLVFKDTHLQKLNMSNVNLKFLNKLGNANLTTIDFSFNKISTINVETFENLVNLKFLDLSHNNIKELNMLTFKDLKALTELRLNSNNIRTISSKHLNDFPSLQILDLSSNLLGTVEGLELFTNLQHLKLSGNLLKVITSGQYLPLTLKTLDVSRNSLYFIGEDTFSHLEALESLDMSYTNNTYIEFERSCIKSLRSLKKVKIIGNKMTSIESILFPDSLEELDLSLNSIGIATKNGLGHLIDLKYLNLSYNHMYLIESGLLENFSRIAVLDLSGNNIRN